MFNRFNCRAKIFQSFTSSRHIIVYGLHHAFIKYFFFFTSQKTITFPPIYIIHVTVELLSLFYNEWAWSFSRVIQNTRITLLDLPQVVRNAVGWYILWQLFKRLWYFLKSVSRGAISRFTFDYCLQRLWDDGNVCFIWFPIDLKCSQLLSCIMYYKRTTRVYMNYL